MRDRDVRNAIKSLLEKTSQFDEVSLKGLPEDWGMRAGSAKAVVIEPFSVAQRDLWDGGPSTGLAVTSQVNLTIMVRNSDPQLCDEECERLLDVAIDNIQGKSLASFTNPDHSRFLQAQFQKRVAPTRRLLATFGYEYIVDGWAEYDDEIDS